MSLHYCIKTSLIKIGQKYFSWMSQSSTSSEVMGGKMYDDLMVKDKIANTRFLHKKYSGRHVMVWGAFSAKRVSHVVQITFCNVIHYYMRVRI